MLQIKGNIWDYYLDSDCSIGITTNGVIKKDGTLTMGKGVALQAKRLFPFLPQMLGDAVRKAGNEVHYITDLRIFTFPVKYHYTHKAVPALIDKSCKELLLLVEKYPERKFILPRPGVGNGRLDWETEVEPILIRNFCDKDSIIIVEYEPELTGEQGN